VLFRAGIYGPGQPPDLDRLAEVVTWPVLCILLVIVDHFIAEKHLTMTMIFERPGSLRLGDPILVPESKDVTRYTRKALRERYPVDDLLAWARERRLAPKLVTTPVTGPDLYQTHLVYGGVLNDARYSGYLGELVSEFPDVRVPDDPKAHGFRVFGKNILGGHHIPEITGGWIARTYPILVIDNDQTRWMTPDLNEARRAKMWCTDNMSGTVFWGHNYYRFQTERDAVVFKMRWM
jgi:hypothetical protein